jgi:hypothetical protein
MLELKRAIFLKGVYDPADTNRITTTLYRPKHHDLRLEDGYVRSGPLLVPMNNVVELQQHIEEPVQAPVESAPEAVGEPVSEEPRRRGRPRKNPLPA